MQRIYVPAICLAILTAGCQSPSSRLNAPPHGEPLAESPDLQGTYVYMADNALLETMSVGDYHFLPHRAILSSLGKQRLNRLSTLMEEYGGTIRFDTAVEDESLVNARVQSILTYLSEIGVDTRKHTVTREAESPADAVTRGAEEAILIKLMEGTYRPRRGSGGGNGAGAGGGFTIPGMTGNN